MAAVGAAASGKLMIRGIRHRRIITRRLNFDETAWRCIVRGQCRCRRYLPYRRSKNEGSGPLASPPPRRNNFETINYLPLRLRDNPRIFTSNNALITQKKQANLPRNKISFKSTFHSLLSLMIISHHLLNGTNISTAFFRFIYNPYNVKKWDEAF